MWSLKRSRPSSKRRLTKKVKRLSSGSSVWASAIGVVDEQRLRTKGEAGAATSPASAALAEAMLHFGVIASPPARFNGPHPKYLAVSRHGGAQALAARAVVAAPPAEEAP